jgi:hypothetical protein
VFCTSDMMTWHFAEDVSWRSTGLIWARVFFRLVLGDADVAFRRECVLAGHSRGRTR